MDYVTLVTPPSLCRFATQGLLLALAARVVVLGCGFGLPLVCLCVKLALYCLWGVCF